ncbi:hypothetical protein J437_LFUL014013 [Ladona fulva]|uniref:ATPase AAA-type core domain-containing protein n=1 Tax=Ladona fulva TaxID=123851 RepID=A0A8K0KGF0_LADFU|nr:hypothetical protein J437_LFUL014013 [Ladona fulva]
MTAGNVVGVFSVRSGGQQRRVSFAAALLHDAELLILDEPTVGLDPELRQSIWDYLKEITESGSKTVIITTHYVEEAKQAHTIGLMRKGRLLAQDKPENLLRAHGTDSLEDVFLDLSKVQEKTTAYSDLREVGGYGDVGEAAEEIVISGRKNSDSKSKIFHRNKNELALQSVDAEDDIDSFERRKARAIGRWRALLLKNYVQLSRNLGSLLFIFGFPLLTFMLFFLAIGRDPEGLHLAVVNQEVGFSNVSSHYCVDYQRLGCNDTALSCRYLQTLVSGDVIQEEYYSEESEAVEAVREGRAWGALIIPENFSSALEERREGGKDTEGHVLAAGEISVYLDMSSESARE